VKQADTPAALAVLHRLDAAAVAATLDDYNRAARGETADAFGRRDFALAPLTGTLHICRVVPGLFHTQGGLMVDIDGRVLRPGGKPIANLFAGGGAAVGLSGRTGAGGYASGNGLLSAVGPGRLAGLAATREIAREAVA
jgi:fumarate reductase flavoprotein subunit